MSSTATTRTPDVRFEVKPLPSNITCTQPGRGWVMRLELGWGRIRRWWLRTFRPGYVRRMRSARRGDCVACTHDIIDARDLKFYRNVCGFEFAKEDDPFQWRGKLCLARWGLAELLIYAGSFALISIALVVAGIISGISWLSYVALAPAGMALFIVSFFRDPVRRIPAGTGIVVSPADGTIDDIEELDHCEFIDGPALKVGIFLSVFSVHINRAPDRSRVIELRYFRGKFGNALRLDTAKENEQLWLMLEGEEPPYRRMIVKQIVGAIARRIVCDARPGEVLERGEKFGMIKFGSRTELYLSKEGLCVDVKMNQSMRGGATVVARYLQSERTL